MNKPCWIVTALALLTGSPFFPTTGRSADSAIDFNREIRPILSDKCFSCHGPDAETRDADFRLDIEADAKRDLGGYFGLVPGKAEDSEVWRRIRQALGLRGSGEGRIADRRESTRMDSE